MPKQLSFKIEEIETFRDEYKLKPFVSTKLAVWKILPQVTHTDTTDTVSVTKAQGRVSIERVDEPRNIDGGQKNQTKTRKLETTRKQSTEF